MNYNFVLNEVINIAIIYSLFLIISFIVHIISQKLLVKSIRKILSKTKFKWSQYFSKNRALEMGLVLFPLIIFQNLLGTVPDHHPDLLLRIIYIAEIVIFLLLCFRVLDSFCDLLESPLFSIKKPIRGYIQLCKIILGIIFFIIIISVAMQRSPLLLISGLGAISAVLMLVFKDTIVSFVASLQISAFDIVTVGDWLEIPSMDTDGEVLDISLYQIKIKNWDNSISIVPIYKVLDTNFRNWKGMILSGGRRIKRAINIDQSSIHFLSEEDIERLSKIELIKNYLGSKRQDVIQENEKKLTSGIVDKDLPLNMRRLTNIGTFRVFIENYLKQHPNVHQDMTFLIRQLAPGPTGLPIEIYVFSKNIEWGQYEYLQCEIFDYLLAAIQDFGLRVYQNPTGHDISKFAESKGKV